MQNIVTEKNPKLTKLWRGMFDCLRSTGCWCSDGINLNPIIVRIKTPECNIKQKPITARPVRPLHTLLTRCNYGAAPITLIPTWLPGCTGKFPCQLVFTLLLVCQRNFPIQTTSCDNRELWGSLKTSEWHRSMRSGGGFGSGR